MPRCPSIGSVRRHVAPYALVLGLGVALCPAPGMAQDSGSGASPGGGTVGGSGAGGGTVGSSGSSAPSGNAGASGFGPSAAAGANTAGLGGPLPTLGAAPRVGDLRSQLVGLLGPQGSTAARPPWLLSPSMGVDLGITDNVRQIQSPRTADAFLLLSPQLLVSADAANVTANIAYAPQVTIYAKTGALDQVYENFNGQAVAALVPNRVFLDLRGAITQGSQTGVNQVQTQGYNTQNSIQTITYGVSPYAVQNFGSWGTGTVRYNFDQSMQSNQSNQVQVNANPGFGTFGQPGYGAPGNLTTNTETANFTTGENLERFNVSTTAQASQYTGTQASNNGHSEDANVELTYALSHKISVLSGIGYQVLDYGNTNGTANTGQGYNNSGITYNIGFTYTPNPDTSLTVRYGRQDGSTDVNFDLQFAPTARTRLIARYTNGVTTGLQQAQAQLNNTTVGPNGTLVDTNTGAPVLNVAPNQQNSVYLSNQFSGTLLFLRDRDSYSVSVGYGQQTTLTNSANLLNNGVVPAGTKSNTTTLNASWQHDLAPDMSFSATGQYGLTTNTSALIGTSGQSGGNQDTSTLSISAVLTKQFSETLSGSVRYTYTSQVGAQFVQANSFGNGINTGTYSQNVLLVGLRKSF